MLVGVSVEDFPRLRVLFKLFKQINFLNSRQTMLREKGRNVNSVCFAATKLNHILYYEF